MRAVSVAFSLDLPSRRKNEPGILPAAYIRSSMSTVRGRKSTSRRLPTVAVQSTIVSPAADDDRATRLLREFARLEGDLAVADIRRDAGNVKHAHLVFYLRPPGWRPICFQNSRSLYCEGYRASSSPVPVAENRWSARARRPRIPDPKSRRTRAATSLGAAVGLEAVEVEAEELAPAPRGAGRRPGRGRRRASRPSRRSAPAAPAASAAACRAGERGCLLATGKWRKTSRRGRSRSRAQSAAQCGQPRSA